MAAEQRVDWREAEHDEFVLGPTQPLTDQEKRLVEEINDQLGWEKFRLVEVDEEVPEESEEADE
jgi:hypothetical protein